MTEERSTKKQKELLNFVDSFIQGNGYGPSYREIMRALGYRSVATVSEHIDNLIAKGYLAKRDHSARSLEVLNNTTETMSKSKKITSSQEKWLVDVISQKLEQYKEHGLDKTRDELYVLIGALKVLGLEEAHQAMKSKLKDIVS